MIVKPNVSRAYIGVLSECFASQNVGRTLIVESGVLGGDIMPSTSLEATRAEIEKVFDDIARETGDDVDVRFVGSVKFGNQGLVQRATFGDIDVIIKMDKLETLSRIKQWVIKDKRTSNIRDIKSKKSGTDLDVDTLSDQFSFLFPIYKGPGQPVTQSELRYALQNRFDQTTWKKNHDERLRLQSNLENGKDRRGMAMVQVDVMRIIVGDVELERLQKRAQAFSDKLDKRGDKLDELSEYRAWLSKFLSDQEVEDFESHYEYLRQHGELQSAEDQRDLAALYYLKNEGDRRDHLNNRFDNVEFRYGFHPDALQMLYYIANQVGVVLDDDDFNKKNLNQLITMAVNAGILKEPKLAKADGSPIPPAEQKRLTISMLQNPQRIQEALDHFKGKHREAVVQEIMRQTRNKRSDETNKEALYRNYGTRSVRRV